MESLFGWVQKIFDALLSFVPTRVIVDPVYKLVKTKWNGSVECKDAGLRWYFPFLTNVELIATERQSLDDIETIKFLSSEGIPFYANAACVYSVTDVILFATRNYDTLDTIRESLSASIFNSLNGKPFKALSDLDSMNEDITSAIDIDLEDFGIEIEMVRLSSLSWYIPLGNY